MKKNRKLLFVLSIFTQLASFLGAVYMFFRKNKPAAGALAVLGGAAAIFGIALIDREEIRPRVAKKVRRTEKQKEKTDDEIRISTEADIASCEIEMDDEPDETRRIDMAIDILKKASEPAEDIDSELESELNDPV